MSPQDKVERVLKEIHVTFSKSEMMDGHPDKVIIDRKKFLGLLDRLNQGIYDMMDQYEQTRQSRNNAERAFRKKGDEIIEAANANAEDVYAASVIYTADMIGAIRDLMDQTNDSMNDLFMQFKKDLREQKDKLEYEAMVRNPETAYLVSNEEFDKQLEELGWSPSDMVTMAGMYIDRGMYNMKKSIRDFFREILELLFQAAALVIDTVRTFFLVVLAILGPIAFALSVWDGFQNTLTQWICRYIQVYLWLPVSDMFSTILAKIQVLMLQNDIERMQADPNFSLDSSDGVYIVFLCIGIIGYFTIPTVAGWIIQAGGMGGYGRNVNQMAGRAGSMAGSVAGAAAGNVVGRAGKLLK